MQPSQLVGGYREFSENNVRISISHQKPEDTQGLLSVIYIYDIFYGADYMNYGLFLQGESYDAHNLKVVWWFAISWI